MMAQARYTVMIPQKDNLGNNLGDVASAAHHWLRYGPAPSHQGSFIHRNIQGNWRDDEPELFDHLVTVAEDHPEMDSHIKQLAAHVGDATNQWGVFVMKEGKSGIQSWVIDNPNYAHGEPAELARSVIASFSEAVDFLFGGFPREELLSA
jgi:hypothetical protein